MPDFEFRSDEGGGGVGAQGGRGGGPAHCSNDVQDSMLGETGVDCGGNCPACGLSCDPGWDECDRVVTEGKQCETNTVTNPMHCGACGNVCEIPGSTPTCSGGKCILGACIAPFQNCDTLASTGCEANLTNDAENCGRCGSTCSTVHGTPSCRNSECLIECEDGWADCDENAASGCETPVSRDVENCGACEEVCVPARGETAYCVDGECGSTACDDGLGDCDGNQTCTHDLLNDPLNCGRCGNECLVSRGEGACVEGVCVVDSCNEGWENCDAESEGGGYADGCETNVNADEFNCGACGEACEIPNAESVCLGGECRVSSCLAPYVDCNGDGQSCEVNTNTDARNCGGCRNDGGMDCQTVYENAAGACEAGACKQGDCAPGFLDCTNQVGCETDPTSSDQHCGACGVACQELGGDNRCVDSVCTPVCNAGLLNCDDNGANGCETDPLSDAMHCGACRSRCLTAGASATACENGECQPECLANFLDCDENGRNGCEVDRRTNAQNCGGCDIRCLTPVGTEANACQNSECQPECASTYGDCNEVGTDGCETRLISNNAHCGACGRACQSGAAVHATSNTCNASGVCVPQCQPGWGACSNPQNGCTTQLNTPQRCGSCNTACSGNTPLCVELTCQAQIAVGSTVTGGVAGHTLTLNHTLQAGANRMILAAIAGRSTGSGGVGQARPETVTYGGTPMTALGELNGGNTPNGTDGQASLFYYYLLDPLGSSGSRQVVISGEPGSDPTVVSAAVVQLTGVSQSDPFGAQASGVFNTQCQANAGAGNPSHMLNVDTAGSLIFSLVSAQYPAEDGSPGVGLTQILNYRSGTAMSVMAGHRGTGSPLPAGTYPVGWTYGWCNNSVHYAIVIHPARAE